MRDLDPAEQGQRRGVCPRLDTGQARAGASAGSRGVRPAQSGRAGRVVEMWGRLTKQVRPRPSPSAPAGARGRAELLQPGLRLAGQGRPGGPGAESRGAAGARSSPVRSPRPSRPHGNFPTAELAAQCPATRRLGDYPGPGLLRLHSSRRPGQHVEVMAVDRGSS